ncbi:MAG: hypothetical protein GWO24_27345, partial [Akkermansiaceae bacterium]|nr:hypothetical protein [Akkermansiaceae bacterium]
MTAASSGSNLQPVASRKILVTKRGATIKTGATSATHTVHNGALRFATTDKVMIAG